MPIIQHDINLSNHLLTNGPQFCTHKAVTNGDSFSFKPTYESIAYSMIYFGLGIIALVSAFMIYQHTHKIDLSLFVGGFGVAIGLLGFKVTGGYLAVIRFDKETGVYEGKHLRSVAINNIVGLQINQKQLLGYSCYELNLLTKGGRRLNILNHGGLQQMRNNGKQLANFLNINPANFKDCATGDKL